MHKTLRYCVLWLLASCTIEVPLGTSGEATTLEQPPALREQPRQNGGNAGSSAPGPLSPATPKPTPIPSPTPFPAGEPSTDDWRPGDEASWPSFGRDLEQSRAAGSDDEDFSAEPLAPYWTRAAAVVTATPVVFGGVVYFGDWAGTVQAARADSGQLLWQAKVDSRVTSSAFVTDALVYVAAERGTVHAFDRITGELRFQRVLPDDGRARVWSSPMVADGVLIIGRSRVLGAAGSQAPLLLLGIDALTGELRWQTEGATSGAAVVSDSRSRGAEGELTRFSTAAIDVRRKRAYVAAGRGRGPLPTGFDVLAAVDYESGQLIFSVPVNEANLSPGPTSASDPTTQGNEFQADSAPLLFTADGGDSDPGGADSIDLIGVGGRRGTYAAHARDDGKLVWVATLATGATRTAATIIGPAAHADGSILVAVGGDDNRSLLASLHARTGMMRWQAALDGLPTAAPAVAGDALLAIVSEPVQGGTGALGSTLLVWDVQSGMQLGSTALSFGSMGGIAIADGRALVSTGTAPNAVLPSKGAIEVYAPQ